jgi:hypothetical protein
MISRLLIRPFIAFATLATLVAQDTDPEKAVPVDESLLTEVETIEEAVEETTEEAGEEAVEPAVDVTTEEAAEDPVEETPPGEKPAEPELLEEDPPGDPAPGLAVRIEKLQSGNQAIDPKQVRVLAPFPAKLLAKSPAGWRIESSESAPHFTRDVELSPGKHISLTVRPHVLVPDADGSTVFSIPEPGYAAPLGYHQSATVGAILSTSIHQLDKDAAELGKAIEQLQQLLVSLPKTEQAPAAPEPQPVNKRLR